MANPNGKKLLKEVLVYGLGTFGSKLIVFLLLPLYTHTLSKEEFGSIELLQTILAVAVPVIGLQISDALYRFLLESENNEQEKTRYISTGFAIVAASSLAGVLVYLLWAGTAGRVDWLQHREAWILLLVFTALMSAVGKQITRGLGLTQTFVASDMVTTAGTAAGAVYFLAVLDLGVDGFLYSLFLSHMAALVLLLWKGGWWRHARVSEISLPHAKRLLAYALPLLPNLVSWWIIQAVDRYFISAYEGYGEVGLYAVGMKLASIIALMTSVFHMAWQSDAVRMYHSEDKDRFFSAMFQMYCAMLSVGIAVLFVILKPLIGIMAAPEYASSWKYASLLLLSSMFAGISGFYGITYVVTKQTKGAFYSSLAGAGVSITLNLLLIPAVGTIGAAIANMAAFLLMWLIRVKHTRRYLKITMNYRSFLPAMLLLLVLCFSHAAPLNELYAAGLRILLLAGVLMLYRSQLLRLVRLISSYGRKRREKGENDAYEKP
ncbi:lipopolysaccharide biosynthesis protein [Paenibacillus mucilaginosus]|uniref:Exopolysaccharide biosynthesis protein n=2 Tax=Paenibacillus mucilaginosus TaxID=61624 RepID=I0BSD4_9BACL|nr:oligosaccharide flippase family protein [Paenibacillus mucilaginosus]AEI45233.1 exopolysaccharide biosynthesis protein, putative [Paenibacillus mucilaginosus KNP414]AFH65281.1 exopolysaccharide biosynthesis protein [Paenibacillus mucilaginosus K02]MCG7212880.1 oligosaccharide flippase family protein [Paenibacillus mucilaginosus]WDM26702.1 oligosaccharide flippase family protein [Paenibacillus mucilaginosus]WFA21413.1 exopolysaccharide biosynthesis protein [Paenibacillus mucilaginosus]